MSRKSVLIVDDNLEVRLAFRAVLNLDGFAVHLAEDGRRAIEQASLHHPAAILMDIDMPGMSGLEAAEKLKDDPSTVDIPIIAVTGRESVETRSSSDLFADFVQKPIGSRELMARLEKLIGPP